MASRSVFGDTTQTKVFVGGLAWQTRNEGLRAHFEQYGEIVEAVVISEKSTGRSKGYGFVTFADPESARRACEDSTPVIDGRRTNCNIASLGRSVGGTVRVHASSSFPFSGGISGSRGSYVGIPAYHQQLPYYHNQAFSYPYGYMSYGPDLAHSQDISSCYVMPRHVPLPRAPGMGNPAIYSYLGQPLPSGRGLQVYATPNQHFMQFSRPNSDDMAAGSSDSIQVAQPPGCT